jgi:hypothetical protein
MIDTQNSKEEDALIEAFENCSLPLELFRHQVHVHVVFIYLNRFPVLEVLARFPAALSRYANAHGKHGLYNETISWSYIFLIRERLARGNRKVTWEQFQSENPDLMTWKDSVLKKYYCDETLTSPLAKQIFLFPDNMTPSQTPGSNDS